LAGAADVGIVDADDYGVGPANGRRYELVQAHWDRDQPTMGSGNLGSAGRWPARCDGWSHANAAAHAHRGRYHGAMNRRRRPYAVLLQLAFVATLLMALAPLVSRWQQAQGPSVMLMPGGMAHVMPPHEMAAHAMPAHHMTMHGSSMHDMSMHDMSRHPAAPAATAPAAPIDPHAGHGEACEYCMMASRLMPWLAVLILLLPALRVIAPPVLRSVATPRSLRWPAHAARGPPLHA